MDKVLKNKNLHNRPELKGQRKKLCNNATSAEAVLWRFLKNSQLYGRKIRRQHSIGGFIVDFCCPKERLVIELDGIYHFTEEGMRHDAKKSAFLSNLGIRVLRFENEAIFDNVDIVLDAIRERFE